MTAAATEPSPATSYRDEQSTVTLRPLRASAGTFWLRVLFGMQRRTPRLLRSLRPIAIFLGWRCSRYMRNSILENAAHLLGVDSSEAKRIAFGKRVLRNFYDFIGEMGNDRRLSPHELDRTMHSIVGETRYLETRIAHTGAILLTAHLGAFETAIAALRRREPRVHVVFRRDEFSEFERLRTAQRRRLGVLEAPVDDGLANWVRLRDALRNDDVVLLQGDRVLPGQKGLPMPFFDGHLMMPTGPVKLALASDAPIIPVFSPRTPDGRIDLFLEEPIIVRSDNRDGAIDDAMLQIAAVIERFVRAYPDQWLMIHRAWCSGEQLDGATAT